MEARGSAHHHHHHEVLTIYEPADGYEYSMEEDFHDLIADERTFAAPSVLGHIRHVGSFASDYDPSRGVFLTGKSLEKSANELLGVCFQGEHFIGSRHFLDDLFEEDDYLMSDTSSPLDVSGDLDFPFGCYSETPLLLGRASPVTPLPLGSPYRSLSIVDPTQNKSRFLEQEPGTSQIPFPTHTMKTEATNPNPNPYPNPSPRPSPKPNPNPNSYPSCLSFLVLSCLALTPNPTLILTLTRA
jgi:hypothetical protein